MSKNSSVFCKYNLQVLHYWIDRKKPIFNINWWMGTIVSGANSLKIENLWNPLLDSQLGYSDAHFWETFVIMRKEEVATVIWGPLYITYPLYHPPYASVASRYHRSIIDRIGWNVMQNRYKNHVHKQFKSKENVLLNST